MGPGEGRRYRPRRHRGGVLQHLFHQLRYLQEGNFTAQESIYGHFVGRVEGRGQGTARLQGLVSADPADYQVGQEFLPWGKAYWHGFEVGEKECTEVMVSA